MPKTNYTQVPNELIERMARCKMLCERTRILCAILRKTYGWGKKSDRICLSQFKEMTGMNSPNICRALKSLVKTGLVLKDGRRYQIQEEQEPSPSLLRKLSNLITKRNDYHI